MLWNEFDLYFIGIQPLSMSPSLDSNNHMYVAREMHMQEDVDTVYVKQKSKLTTKNGRCKFKHYANA